MSSPSWLNLLYSYRSQEHRYLCFLLL
ncbi:hypothetical protein E2C01_063861 [Portunus trituberculatus]|uniref:Uncharacterized protein n=1 Tax=Portunus trituberculatus TaxID=210409 RepID=A0A5B7HAA9_PORTR|nr:hypothetical protein [Portunus trituberculatus]